MGKSSLALDYMSNSIGRQELICDWTRLDTQSLESSQSADQGIIPFVNLSSILIGCRGLGQQTKMSLPWNMDGLMSLSNRWGFTESLNADSGLNVVCQCLMESLSVGINHQTVACRKNNCQVTN